MNTKEVWKSVLGFEGYFEISSCGRLRNIKTNFIRKESIDNLGYVNYGIAANGKTRRDRAHRMVAEVFLGDPTGFVVDHLNGNRSDNRVENLEIVTHMENCLRGKQSDRKSGKFSKYRNVHKNGDMYVARKTIQGKIYYFGAYKTEGEAFEAVKNGTVETSISHREKKQASKSSSCVGVSYEKRRGIWHAYVNKKGVRKNLGYFKTEIEAIDARRNCEE